MRRSPANAPSTVAAASSALRPAHGESPPGHDPNRYSEAIESRVAAMRELLAAVRPASDAEALKALRDAFPEASLAARVAAIAQRLG